MTGAIEDLALVGDCETAALVSKSGSVDWLCWPRFDSAACFAALLGTRDNGRWQIRPADAEAKSTRRYRPDTLILETEFETPTGHVRLTDFMPPRGAASDLVRIVTGLSGHVDMEVDLILRFDYGRTVPWVTKLEDERGLQAVAGPNRVTIRSAVELQGADLSHSARFTVCEGESQTFVMTYSSSVAAQPAAIDPEAALHETERFWLDWVGKHRKASPYADLIVRSLITLKALTFAPTGGIVAAPTTSLPEAIGGERNWDYRYCWLRDATLALLALMNADHFDEAKAWQAWLLRAAAGSPSQMQIMYGIGGERWLQEAELPWLPGYEGALPVRVGNAAASQLQLDVFGELMDALYQARVGGLAFAEEGWALQKALLEHLEKIWRLPDAGIWEVRGELRHFTYSKVMAWVAFDRAIKTVERFGLAGPVGHWARIRDEIHDDVCRHGFDAEFGAFTRSYGSRELDASALLIATVGFLPCEDRRIRSTVEAIERDLMGNGLVSRYDTAASADGLPPGEGAFVACSFWLVDAYVLLGRHEDATRLFERLIALCNDVGLLAEEYDVDRRRQVGNFPQAFSHIALINAAQNLAGIRKPAKQRSDTDAK